MSRPSRNLMLFAALLAAGPALAQDSVSLLQGLPGDAVSAYATNEQLNTYVADLQTLTTSWNTRFGIAPIIKASKDSATPASFFTHLISAQAISNTLQVDVPFPFGSYRVWTGPGFGVNDNGLLNNPGNPVDTSMSRGNQFAVTFAEFGGNSNNVIGGVINYLPSDPTRLYVARIAAAVNGDSGACNLAQTGVGAVDSNGNSYFRVDDFGTQASCGGRSRIIEDNLFRVRMLSRNTSALNILHSTGASDGGASDWLVVNNTVVHNTPSCIPENIAGRPILIGSNFSTRYVRENAPGSTTADGSHLDPSLPLSADQRGNVAYTHRNFSFVNSTNGVAAILVKSLGSNSPTDAINVWGLGTNAAVAGTLLLTLPASNAISDPCTGFDPSMTGPGQNEFTHYTSQTAFRGNAQVALGVDPAGRLLAAAAVNYPTFTAANNPFNYIAVARTDAAGMTSWTIAAHSLDDAFAVRGKPILDGPGGNVVGYLTSLAQVTGGTPFGPSISAPMMDSVGNLYFLSAIERLTPGGSDLGVGLIRAVYDPNAFCYELELMLHTGQVLRGRNSNTNFQIRFLSIADSDSINSSTTFSANINQSTHRGIDRADIAPCSPDSLGGLVFTAEIVYDVDGDGQFTKVTGANGDPNSNDQEYNVLLYVGSTTAELSCRRGNINGGPGPVTNTLFVNGSPGVGPDRIACVTPTTPFQLRIEQAPSGGRRYAMYVWAGQPTAATVRNLPQGLGMSCMPTPLTAGPPQPVRRANNIGFTSQLGTENWPGSPTQPAPYNLLNINAGLRRTGIFFFQGFELDTAAPNGRAGVTNGITVISR
jgi:hypothetical protein